MQPGGRAWRAAYRRCRRARQRTGARWYGARGRRSARESGWPTSGGRRPTRESAAERAARKAAGRGSRLDISHSLQEFLYGEIAPGLAAGVAVEADVSAGLRHHRQQPLIVGPVELAIVLDG